MRQEHVTAEQIVEFERNRLEELNRMRANKIKQNEVQLLNHKHEVIQRKIEQNKLKQKIRKIKVDQEIDAN